MSAYITETEIARLRSTDELNVNPATRSSMAIGGQVWDKDFMGGAWLSRTLARNVSPQNAAETLARLAVNPNLKDLHAYVEGF